MAVVLASLIFILLIILYYYLTKNYNYWQKRKIPCPDGVLPGFGHFWDFIAMKASFSKCCCQIYDNNSNHSMVGIYYFRSPALLVLEPELIKTVLQTNFANFHENGVKIDPELDPLLSNNPFFVYGEKWQIGRKRLTYAFSSMRLKILLESVNQVCKQLESFLDRKLNKSGKIELELKDLFGRYTAQVVSSAGFGVNGYCFDDEKEHESFHAIGKSFLKPSGLSNIMLTCVFFLPSLSKILKIPLVPRKVDHFFRTIIAEVMEQRRTDKKPRNDFLQLMAELEQIEGSKIDMNILTSQAMSFFIDGYDTSSTVLSLIAFQLASHLDIQTKLREEVISVLNKYDGAITYEALKNMTYMDQVMNESQRIISTVGIMKKICTEEIELKGSDGLVYRVQPGIEILIPVQGLQKDPRYWERPEIFDPERFAPDRKHSIERFAFLPFGEGPRICVGIRMAQLQIKACLAAFLRKYSLKLSPKTRVPLQPMPSAIIFAVKNGLWAFIEPI